MDADRPPDIIVLAGGDPLPALDAPAGALVIGADAGVAHAWAGGLEVAVAVGDFDSLAGSDVALLAERVATVRRHPPDKDATDLELALEMAAEMALDQAVDRAPARVLVAGIEGGRPDHALANLLLVASPRFSSLEVEVLLEHGRAWVVRDELHGSLPVGRLLSVLPVHGSTRVSLVGCRWPLTEAMLDAGTTRGISNVIAEPRFSLTVHEGAVLCVAPHPEE